MLRDAALSWIRSHLPHPRFKQDFERHLDDATKAGHTCYLVIGPGLTKDRKPYLLHCFCGELFVFELTVNQAQSFKVEPGKVMWGTGKLKDRMQFCEKPAVALTDLEIEDADGLPSGRPIIASVSYVTDGAWPGPCVFRLDYDLPLTGSVVAWHYLGWPVERRGRIRCSFGPIRRVSGGKAVSGPTAVFLRLCKMPDPMSTENRPPISNICAALISSTDDIVGNQRLSPP